MNFKDRPIAITDIETTGDIPGFHEIIEIGLVVCDSKNLEITETFSAKIKPLHIENAVPKAIERNGYKEKDWEDSILLEEAMRVYSTKTKDAVFYAYNVTFDWGFINEAFKQTGVQNLMDYHRFDVMSMVYARFKQEMENITLNTASKIIGIPQEQMPHNALNGAMQAYEVLKKL